MDLRILIEIVALNYLVAHHYLKIIISLKWSGIIISLKCVLAVRAHAYMGWSFSFVFFFLKQKIIFGCVYIYIYIYIYDFFGNNF
jgi:hypothetical protein